MELISVSSKGQIVIPERMRNKHGIKQGTKLVLIEKDNSLILKREDDVMKQLDENEIKEKFGWLLVAEKSLKNIWDNPKDEKIWSKYLEWTKKTFY